MVSTVVKWLFLVAVKFSTIFCHNFELEADGSGTVAKYVSSLITTEAAKDPSRAHGVALVQMEVNGRSEVFDGIVAAVMRSQQVHPTFTHSSKARILPYQVHASSFFVVTTDDANYVSGNDTENGIVTFSSCTGAIRESSNVNSVRQPMVELR